VADIDTSDQELIRRALEARLAEVHTALVCRVISYDPATQTAEIQPMVKRLVPSAKDGVLESEAYPRIKNVPVAFPRSGLFTFHFPLTFGDTGLVVCSERSLAEWRTTALESAPGDARLHALAGAVFFPGLYPMASPMVPSGTNPELGHTAGPRLAFTLTAVEVGPLPTAVALANLVESELATIALAIGSLGGSYVPGLVGATTLKAT